LNIAYGNNELKRSKWIFLSLILLGGCSFPINIANATRTPFLPSENDQLRETPDYEMPSNVFMWIDASVPDNLRTQINLPFSYSFSNDKAKAQIILEPGQGGGINTKWIYALVAAFPTLQDDISFNDLKNIWNGISIQGIDFHKIYSSQSTHSALETLLGIPGQGATEILTGDQMVSRLWEDRLSLGIVPFEDLVPKMKVISINHISPIYKDFDENSYPLKQVFTLAGSSYLMDCLPSSEEEIIPASNYDPQKMTIITMTGTTALSRTTAYRMETKGISYPGDQIRDLLKQGDFLHVSNEASFTPHCPDPPPYSNSMQFCSKPEYIQLLEGIGVNIVELTGNHLLDYNAKPFYETLEMYSQRGWGVFGGGKDTESARQPLIREHHGNRIAWIGCNVVGPEVDWATDYWPGSAKCDFDWMVSEIHRLKSEGYEVIATLQDHELYVPNPEPYIREDFLALAAAGADIVQGSQAHFPQTFEFFQSSNTFIHYGLGNLFFDQMDSITEGIQREFIDRHILYNGKYISTELITTMLEDYSQPRLMAREERELFLQEYFTKSGW
jgi:hypothetical protein